jgi:uncharacterized protein YjbJ (UPF0337 family)
MDENRVEGAARDFGGRVQAGVGRVTGDRETEADGKLNQALGTAQNLYGQAKDATVDAAGAVKRGAIETGDMVRDFIVQRPYTTAVLALGLGWIVARIGMGRAPVPVWRQVADRARRFG